MCPLLRPVLQGCRQCLAQPSRVLRLLRPTLLRARVPALVGLKRIPALVGLKRIPALVGLMRIPALVGLMRILTLAGLMRTPALLVCVHHVERILSVLSLCVL